MTGNNKRIRRSATAHEVHDFQFIARRDGYGAPIRLGNDRSIALDSHQILGQPEILEQLHNRQRRWQRLGFTIKPDLDCHSEVDVSTSSAARAVRSFFNH